MLRARLRLAATAVLFPGERAGTRSPRQALHREYRYRGGGRIVRHGARPPFPGAAGGNDLVIPDEDGTIAYVFSPLGRHLRTINTLTGATLKQFAYDAAGRLVSVTDDKNNVRTIERDANGQPTAIVIPMGSGRR
ncbi:MAG: RHS repeat domain-containing protein [Thermomicrobiales bacterium]